MIRIIDDQGIASEYRYFDVSFSALSKVENKMYMEKLYQQKITVPDNIRLCSIGKGENKEDFKDVLEKITDARAVKCYIKENIRGEETRIKRIIYGIDRVLDERVVNKELVKQICDNDILSSYDSKDINSYVPNQEYIEYLKETYPKLKDNLPQLHAIDKIMQMEENNVSLMLMQGPPGTGKTELILALAKELSKANKNTLISSNVQVACDNVRDRLKNQKEIILKRYTHFGKGEDNRYSDEVIENKINYLKNQVLAGYEFNGNVISSKEEYQKLSKKYNEIQIKIKIKDEEYTKESKFFQKYNESNDKYLEINKELENNIKEINNNNRLIKEINKDYENLEKELSKLEKLLIKSNDSISKILEDKDKLDTVNNKLMKKKEELSSIISEIKNDIKNDNDLKDNSNVHRNLILDTIEKNKSDLEYINSVDLKKEYQLFNNSLKNRKKLESRYFNYFDNSIFNQAVNVIKLLKNDMNYSNYQIVDKKTLLTIKYNQNIYYLEPINNYSKIKEKIEYLCDYNSLSFWDKFKVNFLKLKTKDIEKNKVKLFQDEVNNYFALWNNDLEIVAKNIFDNNYSNTKYNDLKNKYNSMYIDSNNSLIEFDKKISKIDEIIANLNQELNTKVKEMDKLNKQIDESNHNLEKNNIEYAAALKKQEMVINKKTRCQEEKNTNEEEKSRIIEVNSQLEKQNEIDNKELLKLKEYINTITDMYGDRLKKYIDLVKRYKVDRKKLALEAEEIKSFQNEFDNRVNILINNSGNEKYQSIIFDYAKELSALKGNDKSSKLISKYIDGKGNAFNSEFKLDTKGAYNLISMTTNQITQLLKTDDNLEFDYEIIDEASKCCFEDLIISLPRVKKLILIGDYMQLNRLYDDFDKIPLESQKIIETEKNWKRLNEASFSMLFKQIVEYNESNNIQSYDKNVVISVLSGQYRMNKGIFNLISPIYAIHQGLEIEDKKDIESNDVKCIDIKGFEEPIGTAFINYDEIDFIINVLRNFQENRDNYPNIKTIGVITGYRPQANYIRMKLNEKIKGLEIGTFDRFQGKEFDLVIASLVRTKRIGFLRDVRRMNVAFSRSKNHLIIVGNFDKIMEMSTKNSVNDEDIDIVSDLEEEKYVYNKLIPQLYDMKEVYPSNKDRLIEIDNFLKEDDYYE